MEGIHLLGEWYGCAADTPEMTRSASLRALCVRLAEASAMTVVCNYTTDNTAKAEKLFRAMQDAMRPQRTKFQAIHRGGSDA